MGKSKQVHLPTIYKSNLECHFRGSEVVVIGLKSGFVVEMTLCPKLQHTLRQFTKPRTIVRTKL